MTEPATERDDTLARFHQLLLRTAGQLPDDLVSAARQWIVSDRIIDAAEAIAFAAALDGVPLAEGDITLLAELLTAAGRPTGAIDEISVRADLSSARGFTFTAEAPQEVGWSTRVTGRGDALAEAAAAAVAGTGALGLWRAWRAVDNPEAWLDEAAATAVWLVEMRPNTPEGELPVVTARIQDRLITAGSEHPQVEVYTSGTLLPSYQLIAHAGGGLLWAATPEFEVLIARVFDKVDPVNGPAFDPDHPCLDSGNEERQRVLDYLTKGVPLLVTTALVNDVIEPDRGPAVPMTFRTDGRWIWTDAVTYYLVTHGIAPDAELLAHIRENEYQMPLVDGVAEWRAMRALTP